MKRLNSPLFKDRVESTPLNGEEGLPTYQSFNSAQVNNEEVRILREELECKSWSNLTYSIGLQFGLGSSLFILDIFIQFDSGELKWLDIYCFNILYFGLYFLFLYNHGANSTSRVWFATQNRVALISSLILLISNLFQIIYSESKGPSAWYMYTTISLQILISLVLLIWDLGKLAHRVLFKPNLQPNFGSSIQSCICTMYQPITRSTPPQEPINNPEDPKSDLKGITNFSRKVHQILPYLWPSHSSRLQILITISLILMVIGRIVNIAVPYQFMKLLKQLGSDKLELPKAVPFDTILIYIGLRFLQGSIGFVANLQSFAWIPVGQFTTRQLSVEMLRHLHSLSIRFHLNRKTGEILRVQDRGVASVVSVLNTVLFSIIPTIADIIIAVTFLCYSADMYIGLVVLVTTSMYVAFTIKLTDWRTKFRRRCNSLDNEMEAKAVDSLLNFETIKYFGAEQFEVDQYSKAVDKFQQADVESKIATSVLNTVQNVIIQIGLLICFLIGANRVVSGRLLLSEFVGVISLINQLYVPLNGFGGYYRTIQKNFVDMENMLALFKVEPEVKDHPNVKPMIISKGEVIFEDVMFAYDQRIPVLTGLSFKVPAGSTVALVGPSGGGKSTVLRLLFRFYDVQGGRILIDGVDIRDIRQKDLRSAIGVVPQDTVLFNEDIYYNIQYGKVSAGPLEIEAAARAAQIHDRVLTFPDGYRTRVGERGLRLSGGEKQRVALARTFIRDPAIVMLDEATSALDTATERNIQASLTSITKGRTTFIVAHRLSTVVDADCILVIKDGRVVEHGNHENLLTNSAGVYYDMWNKQLNEGPRNNPQPPEPIRSYHKWKSLNTKSSLTNLLNLPDQNLDFESCDDSDGPEPMDLNITLSASCPTHFSKAKSKSPTQTDAYTPNHLN